MKKNILVIDDQEEILEICQLVLEMNGYEVFSFAYFNIALKFYQLNHQKISLILLDMQLLDANHIETIPTLANIDPDVDIIGMSGGLHLYDIEPQCQKHLSSFLKKPFGSKALLSEISLCVN